MSVNVYFTSALMGTVSAGLVAKKIHPANTNVLCVERAALSYDDGYYDLNGIIERCFHWDKVFYVDREELPWPSKKNLLKYYASVWNIYHYYKSFAKDVDDNLCEFGEIENVYTSMPSRLWCLVKDKKAKTNIIEHSIQEYNLLHSMNDKEYPSNRLKNFLDLVVGYKQLVRIIPSKFVLLDGGRCALLKNIERNEVPYCSLDVRELIFDMLSSFEKEFKRVFPAEYEEIRGIRETMGCFKNRYMYLPTWEVGLSDYNKYLTRQFDDISLDNACVFIKTHPRDSRDYSTFFKDRCVTFTLKGRVSMLLPAEILMAMLGMPRLWGSYSSALMYSYWWFGVAPILSVVNSSAVDKILLGEYKNFVRTDFNKFTGN